MPLMAKKGTQKMHHFAHHSVEDCEYGYEASLHLAAKDILSKAKRILLPPVGWNHASIKPSIPNKVDIKGQEEINIDNVTLEKYFDDDLPYLVIYKNSKKMLIRICVNHKVNDKTIKRIKEANISTLQIKLNLKNDNITNEELKEILLEGIYEKKWLYNSITEKNRKLMFGICDQLWIAKGQLYGGNDVAGCPLQKKKYTGRDEYFADSLKDCQECRFFWGLIYPEPGLDRRFVLCSGQEYVSIPEDLDIPQEERSKMRFQEANDLGPYPDDTERCVFCGSRLKRRKGPHGNYTCCENYPKCKYVKSK